MNDSTAQNSSEHVDGQSRLNAGLETCPWCGTYVYSGQPSIMKDSDRMHLSCAAEEDDNAVFDRVMEFGC